MLLPGRLHGFEIISKKIAPHMKCYQKILYQYRDLIFFQSQFMIGKIEQVFVIQEKLQAHYRNV